MRIAAYEFAYGGERTMPLLKYFVIIGALLTALLMVADVLLEPSKAEIASRAAARGEAKPPKPIIKSQRGQHAGGTARTTPVLEGRQPTARETETRHAPLDSTTHNVGLLASEQQVSRDRLAQESPKGAKPKRKTAKTRTGRRHADVAWRHAHSRPGYNSYAQERPAWPFFTQQRPASPFFVPDRSAWLFQGTRRSN
jgi:hypothetical protein